MDKIKVKKKIRSKVIALYVLVACIFIGLLLIAVSDTKKQTVNNVEVEETLQPVVINESKLDKLKKTFEENKKINSDYLGQIYFDSGLIDLPFVQGTTNNTYMRTDWKTMQYDVGGSIFMEASNNVTSDQNVIIYGHNFAENIDPSITKMFSPLRALKEQKNYEENKFIYLFLGDKILKYEIVYVYSVKVLEEDNVQFLADGEPFYDTTNFTSDEFKDYIDKVKARQFYSTGKEIEYADKMLTLQTCIDNQLDKFVINAKLVENSLVK